MYIMYIPKALQKSHFILLNRIFVLRVLNQFNADNLFLLSSVKTFSKKTKFRTSDNLEYDNLQHTVLCCAYFNLILLQYNLKTPFTK